jgi:ABC-type branched-subunit amino acid transport system permease subunit
MAIIVSVGNLIGAIVGSPIVVAAKSWSRGALPGPTKASCEIIAFVVMLLLLHFGFRYPNSAKSARSRHQRPARDRSDLDARRVAT